MYTSIKTVDVAEVIRHFFYMEANREKFSSYKAEILSWYSLPNQDVIQKASEFAKLRDDENPVLVWTVGTQKNKHYLKIDRWDLVTFDLNILYSRGINPSMKNDLSSVMGNLSDFEQIYSKNYEEFLLTTLPEDKSKILIAIARSKPKYKGKLELIDGAHRAISMLKNGITKADAYIGIIKDN